jgi:hypothetical protein
MRLVIETIDTVREVNRWEIADVAALIPDWDVITATERLDRVTELIGDGAEFCKNLEADTIERDILSFQPE